MITATMTTDPNNAQMLWSLIQAEITGPIDGVWTITAPDEVTQAALDEYVANSVAEALAITNRAALVAKATAAVAGNAAFLAIASPTQVQSLAQIKALTKQVTALIKLQTEALTDISGT